MHRKLRIMMLPIIIFSIESSARAQMIVSDPGVEAETTTIATEMGTANTTLGTIDTTMSSILTMFNTPTSTLETGFEALDGGGAKESTTDDTEYIPQLAGATATSSWSTDLLNAQKAAILTDQTTGLTLGDAEVQEAERERLIGTNLQGQAYADDLVYAARFLAADTMIARLSTANIKDAIVLSGGVQVEILKQLNLLGQSISMSTATAAESWLAMIKQIFQYKSDHEKAALSFAATV